MTRIRLIAQTVLVLCVTGLMTLAQAECDAPADFDEWINCRVELIAKARINQRGNTHQTEAPSISGSSTSLVDQSSASDLVGVALNLAGLTSNSRDTETTSTTITISAYALYATMLGQKPLEPGFYLKNRNWRRFSFTLGNEFPDEQGASSNERATLFGFKLLLWDKRDASHPENRARLRSVSDHLRAATPNFAHIAREVQDYLYEVLAPALGLPTASTPDSLVQFITVNLATDQLKATLGLLNDEQLSKIDRLIAERIDLEVELLGATREAIEEIRRAPQLSFSFQSKARKEDGIDEYRGQVVFDYGVLQRLNLTVNASFEYGNSKTIGGDSRGGRLAAEFQYQVTPESNLVGKGPVVFNLGAQGEWMTNLSPKYKAQAKLTIPLMNGVDFPVSLTWASRTELVEESDVKGRFGFSFDFAKLAQAFR